MSLIVKNITFSYKAEDKKILHDFSAEFLSSEITALIGNNGAGKTTLARIIMGILKPQCGSIVVDGQEIGNLTLAQRGRLIGYAMQDPARQIFSATVEEEMKYGLNNLGLDEDEIEKRAEEYLAYFGLQQYKKSFPFALSQGEKQRLVLAAILAMKPAYLILDEPTASLDIKRKAVLGELLSELDCGIIVISHDMDFVDTYCHKIVRPEMNDDE